MKTTDPRQTPDANGGSVQRLVRPIFVYQRDHSFYARSRGGNASRYHFLGNDLASACGKVRMLNTDHPARIEQIPTSLRCRAKGCVEHWQRTIRVTDGKQPPLTLNLSRSLTAASRSLHPLVRRSFSPSQRSLPSPTAKDRTQIRNRPSARAASARAAIRVLWSPQRPCARRNLSSEQSDEARQPKSIHSHPTG